MREAAIVAAAADVSSHQFIITLLRIWDAPTPSNKEFESEVVANGSDTDTWNAHTARSGVRLTRGVAHTYWAVDKSEALKADQIM